MAIDLNQIADQIRKEGYDAGYAACVRDMNAFLSGKHVSAPTSMKDAHIDRENGQRSPRGQTKKWVRSVLAGGSDPLSVKQIQEMLELLEGNVPYSSIQNALMQLDREDQVELVGRGVWRLKTNTTPSEQSKEVV